MEAKENQRSLNLDMTIPFGNEREANIAFNSLRVDKEPRRSGLIREMNQQDNKLIVKWEATEARMLRVSVNGFLDHLALVTQTLAEFGPPLPIDNALKSLDNYENSCTNKSISNSK